MIIDTEKIREGKEQLEIDILKFISSKFREYREEYGITPNFINIQLISITEYRDKFHNYMPSNVTVSFPNVLE